MADAELAQRIDDCIDGDGERRRGPAFAGRPNAERMGRRRHLADASVEERQSICPRHGVVHERARQQLSAPGIVKTLLKQRLPEALHDSAVGLAVDDQRIDGAAHVIDGRIFDDFHSA